MNEVQGTMRALYDPRDPETIRDPYPAFRRLREQAPAYRLEYEGVWAISQAQDVERVMLDWRSFSSAQGNIVHEEPQRLGRTLTTNDPPRHDQLRRLIGTGYTPKRVKQHQNRIQALIDTLIARLPGDEWDSIGDFAGPLAGGVVASLIGIPEEHLDEMQRVIDQGIQVENDARSTNGLAALFDFVLQIVQERRRLPGDDMISDFCRAEDNGVTMNDMDIAVTCGSILGAGFTSTAHQMGNIIHALYRFPDQRDLVLANPLLIPAMIEEGLRYDVSTFCFARQTTCEVTIGDTLIPADSRLMVLLGSANRDPQRFTAPEQFDIGRFDSNRHLGFNIGVHHCMGSSLARLEMRLAFEALLPLLGQFDIDEMHAERVRSLNFRGFRSLPIRARGNS